MARTKAATSASARPEGIGIDWFVVPSWAKLAWLPGSSLESVIVALEVKASVRGGIDETDAFCVMNPEGLSTRARWEGIAGSAKTALIEIARAVRAIRIVFMIGYCTHLFSKGCTGTVLFS